MKNAMTKTLITDNFAALINFDDKIDKCHLWTNIYRLWYTHIPFLGKLHNVSLSVMGKGF